MIIHLIYTAMYAILVVSLLISYDLFIKNFKELNLRLS
ncbi:GGDEF domain-containing protein, partial [Listeria monocytogenes]|nr:GGDEF domain-containing protein [Listeria monocytogenes]